MFCDVHAQRQLRTCTGRARTTPTTRASFWSSSVACARPPPAASTLLNQTSALSSLGLPASLGLQGLLNTGLNNTQLTALSSATTPTVDPQVAQLESLSSQKRTEYSTLIATLQRTPGLSDAMRAAQVDAVRAQAATENAKLEKTKMSGLAALISSSITAASQSSQVASVPPAIQIATASSGGMEAPQTPAPQQPTAQQASVHQEVARLRARDQILSLKNELLRAKHARDLAPPRGSSVGRQNIYNRVPPVAPRR